MKTEHKLVPLEEFEAKVTELRKENWKIDRLITDLGSWEAFPERLVENLFDLAGCKPIINKY
jgi:hypothetical protein